MSQIKANRNLAVAFFLVSVLGLSLTGNAYEQLWHQVEKDANMYEIWVDATEELSGRFIQEGDIVSGNISHIRVVEGGVPVRNFPLIKEIIAIAENAAYMAIIPFSGFILEHHLDVRTRNPEGYDYTYYALPTHCDLALLTTGLDNYYKRKDYYLQAMIEVIAQPKRYEQLNQRGGLTEELAVLFSQGVEAGELLAPETAKLISNLTDVSLAYVEGDSIQIEMIKGEDGQDLFEIMQRQLGKTGKTLEFLNKLAYALQVIDYGGDITSGALRKMFVESCIILPESEERLEALQFYIDSLGYQDPALVAAFNEVKDYYEYSKQHYDNILSNAIQEAGELDNVVTLLNLVRATYLQYNSIGWASGAAKALSGWFLAASWTLEFWGELDHTNVGIMGATLERGIGNKFVSDYSPEIDINSVLDYYEIKAKSTLPSVQTYGGYLFYQNIADNIRIDWWNSYDWAKYLDYLEPFVGGTNPDQKVQYFEGFANYFINWGDVEWTDNLHFLGPSFNVGSDSLYDALANLAAVPDLLVHPNDISLDPMHATPGDIVTTDVNVHNAGIAGTQASVRTIWKALHTDFAVVESSSAQFVDGQNSSQFTLLTDTSTFPADNYLVTIAVINEESGPELDGSNNQVQKGYSIGGTEPEFILPFPVISVLESRPGEEFYAQIDLKDYFYDDDPGSVEVEATGYANLHVTIDANGTFLIRGDYYSFGTEQVTFVLRDPSGATASQTAKVAILLRPDLAPYMELKEGNVDPASGTGGTVFTYRVNYKDLWTRFPRTRFVYINGAPHTMRWSGAPIKDGAEFTFTILGTHLAGGDENAYWFEFGDEMRTLRYPKAGVLSGPDIVVNHDISLRNCGHEPNEPVPGEPTIFNCQVANVGTMPEEGIDVKLVVNGDTNDSYEISHLWLKDESEIIKFVWPVPILDNTEDYIIQIQAVPVDGETSVADNSCLWHLSVVPEPGAVSGWVFDQFNNPIEVAIIRVISSDANDQGSTVSDPCGYYYLDGLMPGSYNLEASKEGEGTATKLNVAVHSQQTTEGQIFNLSLAGTTVITSGQYLEDAFWSPNGDKLVFTYSLRLSPTDLRRILTRINENGSGATDLTGPGKTVDEEAELPKWSPNGSYIAFYGKKTNGEKGIYRISATGNGNDAVQIFPESVKGVTWSPDSSYVAYTPSDNQIWKMTYTGSNRTRLSNTGVEHRELAWSPDNTRIAFTDNYVRLWIFNIDDCTEHMIRDSGSYPSWLPDSSGIIYDGPGGNIHVYRLDTEEDIQVTFDPENESYPTIPRNDASEIGFISAKGFPGIGDYGLFTMPFSIPSLYFTEISAQPDPFTPNGDGQNDYLAIHYKINKPAYVTLKIYDSQGNYTRTLVDNEQQDANSYYVHWDGKNEYSISENAEVYFYRLDMHDDTNDVAIPAHGRAGMLKDIRYIGSEVSYARWSHNGEKVVYLKEEYDPNVGDMVNHIYICDANDVSDANAVLLPTPYDVGIRPAWSRNDNQIVFPSYSGDPDNRPQIAKINLDGTGYTDLTTETPGSLLSGRFPVWSLQQDKITFWGLWNEPPEGNFYYITNVDSNGTSLEQVLKVDLDGYYISPTLLPDGSKIAFPDVGADSPEPDIWMINPDGSGREQLTFNPYTDLYPEFTCDGRRLLFGSDRHLGREGHLELWTKPLDGSDQPRCLSKWFGYGMPSPFGDKILVRDNVIELFLSLTKGAIEGRVLDHETLEPLPEATVYLCQEGLISSTVTNEQGAYRFYNIEPGEYTLNADANAYIAGPNMVVETFPWVVSRNNNLELQREPSVVISEMSDGERIGSVVSVNIEREDGNVAYVKYEYRREGEEWQDLGTTIYPVPARFDTAGPNVLASGNYDIRAIALDSLENVDSSPDLLSVEIDHNAPVATITSPISGTRFNGGIDITASCTDSDIDSVVFQYRKTGDVLWVNIASVDVEEPWSRMWNTQNLLEGRYELRAMATDSVGNSDENPEVIGITVKSVLCDLNDDDNLDFLDLKRLGSYWLTNEPSVDISPPGGNNIINFLDFAVFAECWQTHR